MKLDYGTLNLLESHIDSLYNQVKNENNDLTNKDKNDILVLSAQIMSRLLDLYADLNKRRIDYATHKVYLDNNIIMDLEYYSDYVRTLTKINFKVVDVQKTILGEDLYNKIMYGI